METDIYLISKTRSAKNILRVIVSMFICIILSSVSTNVSAQTVIINPSGDGGFENGSTFSANGWTLVNSASGNSWCVGTVAKSAGANGAYISTSAAGANNNYSNTASRTVHFFKDVTIPAGETQIKLSFKWKCNAANFLGGTDNDDIRVFLASTTYTPVAGTAVSGAGTSQLGGPYYLQGSTYQSVIITLSSALAGTTQRLIFSWRNDNNFLGGNPAGAFDEISLTSCAPPAVIPSNSGPQCAGTTLNLSATGGGTYVWSGPNGFSSTSATPSIANVTADAAGTYTVTVTNNGCSSTANSTVNIISTPVASAPSVSAVSVCQNTPFTLTANAGLPNAQTNATSATIPDAGLLGNTTPISSSITVANSFTSSQVLSVTINISHTDDDQLDIYLKAPNGSQIELSTDNGGSGDNYTNTVFVTGAPSITSGSAPFTGNFSPEQPFSSLTGTANGTWQLVVSDDAFSFLGATNTLLSWTITTKSTTGVTYTWSSTPSGFSGAGASVSASATTNTSYQVTASAGGCIAAPVGSAAINILAPPSVIVSSNAPLCEGTDLNLVSSGGVSYSWTGPNSYTSSTQNPTRNGVNQLVEGNYDVLVTDAFGCTNTGTTFVEVNENPVITVSSQTNIFCNGGNDGELIITGSGGIGPYIFTEGISINFDGIFTGLTAGPYALQIIDGNSCMASSSANITEPDPTTISIAGTDMSLCDGASTVLGANEAVVGTGSWSVISGTAIITDMSNPISEVSGLSIGSNILRWTIDNGVCGSNYSEVNVSGIALPEASVTATQEICNGSSGALSLAFTGTGPWTYAVNGGTPVSTSSNPATVSVSPTSTTSYSVTTLSDAVCTGSGVGSATMTVTNAPPPGSCTLTPATIPVTAYSCVGQTYVVSTNVVGGATKYTWSVPAGTLINGLPGPVTTTTNTVTLTLGPLAPNASGWEICAFAANACGQTNTNCKYIRGALSMPAAISGSNVACAETSGNYSTNAVSGALGYTWTGTNGITFSGSGTNVTANFPIGFTTGTICVAATLPCGYTGSSRCMTVTNGVPSLGAMNGTFSVCPGAGAVPFSVPAAVGVQTYNWTLPAGMTIAGGAGTNAITVNVGGGFTSGNICVVATTACGVNSAPRCKTAASNKPGTPGNMTGVANGVCGQTLTYTIPTVSGATSYTWTPPAGATLATANGSNTIDVSFSNGFTLGQLCVTADNGCGSGTARCLNLKGTPSNPGLISGSSSICPFDPGISYSITPVFGASGYIWTVPAGASIVNGQNSNSILVDWGATAGTLGVTVTGACGNSGTRTLTVTTISCKLSSGILPGTTVNAYPNPVSSLLNIELNSEKSGAYTLEMMDVSGRVVKTDLINAAAGTNMHTIDVNDLSGGMYIMNVKNDKGFTQQIRISVE